jgi:hypothetical protein
MIVGATFGSTWRRISRRDGAPSARADVTKSRCDIESASARTTRAIPVHDTIPITSRMLNRLGPSTDTSAIASSRPGSVSITSVKRIRMKSTVPPKNPAASPIATPMVSVTAIAAMPTSSEIRAPKMIRESTSRPSSSVPSRNNREGAAGSPKVAATARVGSCGAIIGARIATITRLATITPPASSIALARRLIRFPPGGCAGPATRRAGRRRDSRPL